MPSRTRNGSNEEAEARWRDSYQKIFNFMRLMHNDLTLQGILTNKGSISLSFLIHGEHESLSSSSSSSDARWVTSLLKYSCCVPQKEHGSDQQAVQKREGEELFSIMLYSSSLFATWWLIVARTKKVAESMNSKKRLGWDSSGYSTKHLGATNII